MTSYQLLSFLLIVFTTCQNPGLSPPKLIGNTFHAYTINLLKRACTNKLSWLEWLVSRYLTFVKLWGVVCSFIYVSSFHNLNAALVLGQGLMNVCFDISLLFKGHFFFFLKIYPTEEGVIFLGVVQKNKE